MYAEIVVNLPVEGTYHYHIPPGLAGELEPGHLVEIEFGNRRAQGIVLALRRDSPVPETKPVEKLLDSRPVLTPYQLKLAEWLARETLAPLYRCLWLMLPPGLGKRGDVLVTLLDPEAGPETTVERRVLSLLAKRGPLRGRQLARSLPRQNWRAAVDRLVRRGVVKREPVLDPPSVRPQSARTARLAIPPEEIDTALMRIGSPSRQADLLEALHTGGDPMPTVETLCETVGCSRAPLRSLERAGYLRIEPKRVLIELSPGAELKGLSPVQARLCGQLAEAGAPLDRRALDVSDSVLRTLERKGIIRRHIVPATVIPLLGADEWVDIALKLRGAEKQRKALRMLAERNGPVDLRELRAQTGITTREIKALAEDGLIVLGEREVIRDPLADLDYVPTESPKLSPAQETVWRRIEAELESPRKPILLHGVTGSGKTEIYMRALERVLERGRGGIILVPEIALTPQTVRRFIARFPGRVAVIHSKLSEGERYDTWRRIRDGRLDVIIGTRSALFAPLPNPGLIVLDEEHDESYKSTPPLPPPYYHARETGIELARLTGALCILGSATPDLVTYYRAQRGDYILLKLPERIMGHRMRVRTQAMRLGVSKTAYRPAADAPDAVTISLPPVKIVDMRQELRAGNRSIFSRALQKSLRETLKRGEQAILFLNRRGEATFIFCRDCGHILKCPNCDLPMTYHQNGGLICHHCGRREPEPDTCPKCGSAKIKYFGAGTQRVEREVRRLFPGLARPVRWDRDTTRRRGGHEAILAAFASGRANVLIGTQMIAKGLDLPLVTLVGVILAEVGLGMPDYRAAERVFQVLTQVAGRSGRGLLGGRVILQTYNPDHYAIQAAADHNYEAFFAQEVRFRRELGYPPFRRLGLLEYRDPDPARAADEARRIAGVVQMRVTLGNLSATEILGPTPCFFPKLAGFYRWCIIVRSPDPAALLRDLPVGDGWRVIIDPLSVL